MRKWFLQVWEMCSTTLVSCDQSSATESVFETLADSQEIKLT